MVTFLFSIICTIFIIMFLIGMTCILACKGLDHATDYINHLDEKINKKIDFREKFNTLYLFDNNQIFYGYEIIDFEETIKSGEFKVKNPYIINNTDTKTSGFFLQPIHPKNKLNDIEKTIHVKDYAYHTKIKKRNKNDDLRIAYDVVPSDPLSHKQLNQIIKIIKNTHQHRLQIIKEQDRYSRVQKYQKANFC